jgi:TolB-like protein/Tfp pilus assembly protein PilF
MSETSRTPRTLRFGEFEVDLQAARLSKRGAKVKIREQLFLVLTALLERPGEVIARDELRARLWPDGIITDFELNINTAIARLRQALGDSAAKPRFIETVPKRGYRFIGAVEAQAPSSGSRQALRARIAVLPFANLGGSPEQEYLSDAFTEELITGLARLAPGRLGVIARTTAMNYKASRKSVSSIGRELGVDFVVEGSVRRKGNRMTAHVQLIQVSDQTHLAAERYDFDMSDMLGAVHTAARLIGDQIRLSPADPDRKDGLGADRRAGRKTAGDGAAYNLYIRGRYHLNTYTPEGFAKAKQCFEEAVGLAPEYAPAHHALGETYFWIGFNGLALPKDAFAAGVWPVLRALEIDEGLADAHAMLGCFRLELDYNWAEVQREMGRALELDPWASHSRALYALSVPMPLGRIRDMIAELERALELDPLSAFTRFWLCFGFDFDRQYERGLREARLLIEHEPDSWLGHFVAGHLYRDMKMYDQATASLRRASELSGGPPLVLGWLGQALVNSGKTDEARVVLKRLHDIAATMYVPPTSFAWICLGLGDIDGAFTWMDLAIDVRDTMIVPIKTYPFLDPFRDDPRFHALLRRMNLEP